MNPQNHPYLEDRHPRVANMIVHRDWCVCLWKCDED